MGRWKALHLRSTPERPRERGASLVEYALLVVLILMTAIVAYQAFLAEMSQNYSEISSAINGGNF